MSSNSINDTCIFEFSSADHELLSALKEKLPSSEIEKLDEKGFDNFSEYLPYLLQITPALIQLLKLWLEVQKDKQKDSGLGVVISYKGQRVVLNGESEDRIVAILEANKVEACKSHGKL